VPPLSGEAIRRKLTRAARSSRGEGTSLGHDPVRDDVAFGLGSLGDELKIVHHADRDCGRRESGQGAIVVAGTVADAMPARIDRERGHHDEVERSRRRFRLLRSRLAVPERVHPHGLRARNEPKRQRTRDLVHDRIGDVHAPFAQSRIERPQVHFVSFLDRPEKCDRTCPGERLEG